MNIYDEFLKVNKNAGNKLAMIFRHDDGSETVVSYDDLFGEIGAFSASLEACGVRKNSRVAIIAESCPEWGAAYLAVIKSKATAVLIDSSVTSDEIMALLGKSDVACILSSPKIKLKIGNVKLPILNIKNHGKIFDDCVTVTCPDTAAGDSEIASVIFSSGTTKTASGIMHSHDAVIGSAMMCVNCNGIDGKDRFFGILPNSHIYGLYTQVIAPLLLGASVCYIESMNAQCLMGALKSYRPTVFPAVPKVFDLLKTNILKKVNAEEKTKKMFDLLFPLCLKLRKATGLNLGKKIFKSIHNGFGGEMRVMASAGSPLDSKTAEFYYGVGFNMLITYGATETSIPTIGNYGNNITTDSCGKPYPAVSVKLDGSGELFIKSPYMMLGYFGDEEATKAAFDDEGWFRTGDLGAIDSSENIRITGRRKENIILDTGKKVAPDDIEMAYGDISGFSELVVCGIPSESGNYDTVHAFVTAEDSMKDSVTEQLKNRSRSLNQNMKLAEIHFVSEIPKTSLGKPKRFLLRQMISRDTVKNTAVHTVDLKTFILNAIAYTAKIDISEISMNTRLFEELAIDSLGAMDLAVKIEEYLGFNIAEKLKRTMTVSDLIETASANTLSAGDPAIRNYPKNKRRSDYNVFNMIRNLLRRIYNVKINNDAVLPEHTGYIICANHVTNFDYLFITLSFSKARFMNFCCMAKKELFNKSPFNKIYIRIAGLIPVDRSGSAFMALKSAKDKLKEQWGILIHPEGTRSRDGELGEFKKGAAMLAIESGVPIVPAYIKGGHDVYPPSQKLPKLYNWKYLKKYTIEVIYGEPIMPNGLTADDLMQKVNSAIKSLSSVMIRT
ncbi:MAG: AMP-binding protein [Eubacteriales bacterium]